MSDFNIEQFLGVQLSVINRVMAKLEETQVQEAISTNRPEKKVVELQHTLIQLVSLVHELVEDLGIEELDRDEIIQRLLEKEHQNGS